MRRPLVMVGECTGKTADRARAAGWGRLKVERPWEPYPGEPWALDNGAFRRWRRGDPADWTKFDRACAEARALVLTGGHTPPLFGVVPDVVMGGLESLAFSMEWLTRWRASQVWDDPAVHDVLVIPWYLAVQDGMQPSDLLREHDSVPIICYVDGVFLGGSAAWKAATAAEWRALLDAWGGKLHYGRCTSRSVLQHAYNIGADSVDSTQPMWSYDEWERFETAHRNLDARQLPLFAPNQITATSERAA